MMNKHKKKQGLQRLSTLIILVLFVFAILLISVGFAAIISQFLSSSGILPFIQASRISMLLLFMLLVSLFIGTIMAIIGGDYLLQPLHKMIEATKQIAAGNFDIRVEAGVSREFSRLADSFNDMVEELSSIETLRNDFVSNISHEFKTPVVSIRGFAKRLKKNTLSEEKRNEYLDIIIAETERLSNLSTNVLLLSKLESRDKISDKTRFDLDEQIRRSILLLEPYLENQHLTMEINMEPVQIYGNEEILEHLWLNLLNNAIKFSPENAAIQVNLQKKDGYAEVSITDSGIGMDEETKKHVFDKFYQGDKSRVTTGNGLGLSLVKRIVKLSGGSIHIDSTPGEGSCFTVLLPIDYTI